MIRCYSNILNTCIFFQDVRCEFDEFQVSTHISNLLAGTCTMLCGLKNFRGEVLFFYKHFFFSTTMIGASIYIKWGFIRRFFVTLPPLFLYRSLSCPTRGSSPLCRAASIRCWSRTFQLLSLYHVAAAVVSCDILHGRSMKNTVVRISTCMYVRVFSFFSSKFV